MKIKFQLPWHVIVMKRINIKDFTLLLIFLPILIFVEVGFICNYPKLVSFALNAILESGISFSLMALGSLSFLFAVSQVISEKKWWTVLKNNPVWSRIALYGFGLFFGCAGLFIISTGIKVLQLPVLPIKVQSILFVGLSVLLLSFVYLFCYLFYLLFFILQDK